jgi:hypothetical protein
MRPPFQTLWVAQVWVTAAALLVAGLPHYRCRCPDGRIKLFCPGPAERATLCCGAGCCPAPAQEARRCRSSSPEAAHPVEASCCGHRAPAEQALDPPASDSRVERPGCQKTLAQADFVAVTPAPAAPTNNAAAGLFLLSATLAPLVSLPTGEAPGRPSWERDRLPPPTDLIIAHQHLLI